MTVLTLNMNRAYAYIHAAMTQIEVDGVTGTMKWTADGENNKGAMALVFRDGVAVAFNKG